MYKKQKIGYGNFLSMNFHIRDHIHIIFRIHIVSELMRIYPVLFETEDYFNLLQTLATLQIECNDDNTLHNIYVCFSQMLVNQNLINLGIYEVQIQQLWKVIGETTLR